ncbi:MAG: HRDC domain-containing protein [Tenacibaculum sp.]|nr:HRDC domain-containing protein [Tenacibaculum sp.]
MINKELELAQHFIEKTNRNLFLTGKAGTGKTTFLRELQKKSPKRMVVVAPTGVASINARGVTIHSFFQLPFGPIIPNSSNQNSVIQRKFIRAKIDLIRSLDLVIIDEISMVRADVLDGIDEVLRRYKDGNKPFGGTQMLFIGDLQQLSPIVRPDEWSLLSPYYKNAYFFNSLAYQKANVISIELKHIYRQQNQDFIKILNEIRNNSLSEQSAELLNKQYNPNFNADKESGYITLTTHNNRAKLINNKELNKLTTKTKTYKAIITGKFYENNYPISDKIELKVGAQVMFVKNDISHEKRYFNGKIGTVISLEKEKVIVKCAVDDIIEVGYVTWDNISYSLDKETQAVSEKVEGTFTQIPLTLAWAITIHKSQGLTFEKAIIDAEASFAHGQTYVALSRCKTLDGIVLKTPIKSTSIISDITVSSFNKQMEENQPTESELKESQKQFQLELIEGLFNYHNFLYPINRLIDLYYTHKTSLKGNIIEPLQKLKDEGVVPLIKVASGFKNQLNSLSVDIENIEESKLIQERFKKAVSYFREETKAKLTEVFNTFSFSTENKAIEKDFERQIQNLEEFLHIKTYLLSNLPPNFSTDIFLHIRAKAILNKPEKKKKQRVEVTTTENKELFEELRLFRLSISNSENIPPFQVFTQKTLFELCEYLPQDKKQLKKINGMGKIRVQKYGGEILEIINEYVSKNDLE